MNERPQKVAVVTGGSQGIGAGHVDGYRQRRWAVVAKSLAVEHTSRGIRVNAVAPGIIQTPLHPAESYTPEALVGKLPRSGAWARSVTSWTASCSWSQRRTSPERACTSTAAEPPVNELPMPTTSGISGSVTGLTSRPLPRCVP